MQKPDYKIRILVVDDEPDVAAVIMAALEEQFEVLMAPNGLVALERLDRVEPDLVIMDVMMPVLDGFDTTRALRKDARFSETPVLFLSARSDASAVREGLKSGGDVYLEKPFSVEMLLNRIDALLTMHDIEPRAKRLSLAELRKCFPEDYWPEAPPTIDQTPDFASGCGSSASLDAIPPVDERPRPPADGARETPPSLSEQLAAAMSEPMTRVLVVDDDPDTVAYVKSILAGEFEVVGTTDSEAAPDKIIAYQPEIVILDVNMPKLNGFHLSQLMRVNRRLRCSKLVFISSRTDRESVETAYRMGAAQFLEKPFTPEVLRRRLHDLVRAPDFQRTRKRIDYNEVQRREGDA